MIKRSFSLSEVQPVVFRFPSSPPTFSPLLFSCWPGLPCLSLVPQPQIKTHYVVCEFLCLHVKRVAVSVLLCCCRRAACMDIGWMWVTHRAAIDTHANALSWGNIKDFFCLILCECVWCRFYLCSPGKHSINVEFLVVCSVIRFTFFV